MDRAYSLLDIKSVNEEQRVIEGIASTPTPDRMDDIVEPMGAEYAVPMPFLWQHDSGAPVGHVEFAKPTKSGIPFKARLVHPDTVESATLKDRLQLAWDSVKQKLVGAVSIGFRPLEYSRMENGGLRFISWEWLELSLVTIPANAEATINTIKSIDREQLAAALDPSRLAGLEAGAAKLRVFGSTLDVIGDKGPELIGLPDHHKTYDDPQDDAASGQSVHVAKLNTPDRAWSPFVINKINHLR